jgi:caa(3)-type oxidase subunit IV
MADGSWMYVPWTKANTSISHQPLAISHDGVHDMSSDPEAVKKSVRAYMTIGAALFAFTVITVAVNQVHLAIPLAITVALVIASVKGSMVASVFMHLSHEKKWIYGALLLTVAFFIVLMSVPFFTISDTIGTPIHVASPAAEHGAEHK